MKQQESGLFEAAGFLDQLIVIKNENHWSLKCSQLVYEERYHRARDVRDRDLKRPEDLIVAEARVGSLQRVRDTPPQPARVIVAAIEGDPSEPPLFGRAGQPLRYESGLAEARRSLNEDELGSGGSQNADQCLPLHPLLVHAGSVELSLHRHVRERAGPGHGYRPQTAPARHASFAHLYKTSAMYSTLQVPKVLEFA
jgi:hypothetical protein